MKVLFRPVVQSNSISPKKQTYSTLNPYSGANMTSNFENVKNFPYGYVSFSGGYSIDLEETINNFDRVEKKTGKKVAPVRVEKEIIKQLEIGNPDALTLIDIHRKAYKNIKDADSLDQIRAEYPEFEQTKSISEVDLTDSKFVENINQGKNPIFNNKEDLSLQILKLYWGDGFSLSDIVANTNTSKAALATIMEKLNIPRVEPRYGMVLKLSDREYNSRLSAAMSDKMAEIYALKQGLPLIPKKMSDEQKEKISKALTQYYAANPDRILDMSERQKEFYKNHPDAALMFKLVLYKAWNMDSCSAIRRNLRDFLKQKNTSIKTTYPEEMVDVGIRQQRLMNYFWNENPHLKKKFSAAMNLSWEKLNANPNIDLIKSSAKVPFFPKQLEQNMMEWAKKQKIDTRSLDINNLGMQLAPQELLNVTKEHKVINEFFKANKKDFHVYNDIISKHIIGIHSYFTQKNKRKNEPVNMVITKKIESFMFPVRNVGVQDVLKLYAEIVQILKKEHLEEDYQKLSSYLNTNYEKAMFNLGQ